MVENAIKMTMNSLTDKNSSEDILEKVLELKQKVGEIEDIVELRTKSEEINDRFRHKENDNTPNRNHHHPVKCNLCSSKFSIISNLEKHIKKEHREFKPYKCDTCNKEFVTKWRLEKHMRIHSLSKVKQCKYFKKKIFCPFDELGCKFGHNETIQDGHTANDKSEFIQKEIKELKKLIQEGITDHHNEEFHTSTPKKPDECNKCFDTSECVDCMVKHMLGTHKVARALFDGWPQDRLHMLL